MPGIAVFLCRCFGEIDRVIDLDSLQKNVEKDHSIVFSSIIDSLCLADDIKKAASRIRECGAEKVLIGGCSFLGRGSEVVDGLIHEGIKRSDIGMVDLREACAWIHTDAPERATQKALNLIRMEIEALHYRQVSDDVTIKVCPEAMIVGAGPAGLFAAQGLLGGRPQDLHQGGDRPHPRRRAGLHRTLLCISQCRVAGRRNAMGRARAHDRALLYDAATGAVIAGSRQWQDARSGSSGSTGARTAPQH